MRKREYTTPFGIFYASLRYGEASELARKAGVGQTYLWRMAKGYIKAGRKVASRLQSADERITFGMLWPDDYED